MNSFRILSCLIVYSTALICNVACKCAGPKIIHADFCDVLNDLSKDVDHKPPDRKFQEKTLYFIVNKDKFQSSTDSIINNFIRNDEFVQKELFNGYDRLTMIFYKESKVTGEMMKQRSSAYLPYCENDIISEYGWKNGRPSDTLYFENGMIKGAENIQLIPLDSLSK